MATCGSDKKDKSEVKQKLQHLVVIRHGERLDNVDGRWVFNSPRPYDPPLTENGMQGAKATAHELCDKNIHVVVCSPFLRCLQTCREILSVLNQRSSANTSDSSPSPALAGAHLSNGVVDVFNRGCGIYQQPHVPAPDVESLGLNILSRDSDPLPTYPEKTKDGLHRFNRAFCKIADDHYPQNVLVVTHGYGVCQAMSLTRDPRCNEGVWVDYCGYVVMSRTGNDKHNWTLDTLSDNVIIG